MKIEAEASRYKADKRKATVKNPMPTTQEQASRRKARILPYESTRVTAQDRRKGFKAWKEEQLRKAGYVLKKKPEQKSNDSE